MFGEFDYRRGTIPEIRFNNKIYGSKMKKIALKKLTFIYIYVENLLVLTLLIFI